MNFFLIKLVRPVRVADVKCRPMPALISVMNASPSADLVDVRLVQLKVLLKEGIENGITAGKETREREKGLPIQKLKDRNLPTLENPLNMV